jgi:hypothetical protein
MLTISFTTVSSSFGQTIEKPEFDALKRRQAAKLRASEINSMLRHGDALQSNLYCVSAINWKGENHHELEREKQDSNATALSSAGPRIVLFKCKI